MELEPIREQERVPARSVTPLRDGVSIVDFGKNLAGVCRLKLPDRLLPGQEIVLEHMEFLDEDGDLYLPTRRGRTGSGLLAAPFHLSRVPLRPGHRPAAGG